MADWYWPALRRRLLSAERLSEAATALGLRRVKTRASRSSASLVCVTRCDHFRVVPPARRGARLLGRDEDRAPARRLRAGIAASLRVAQISSRTLSESTVSAMRWRFGSTTTTLTGRSYFAMVPLSQHMTDVRRRQRHG